MSKQHELIGKILDKEKGKVYNKKSSYYGNTYFRLSVKLENNPEWKEILVFENGLENKQIWTDIKESNYLGKKYVFYCSALVGNYRIISYQLVNWKQLENHGSN